jgi:hypothetical protein
MNDKNEFIPSTAETLPGASKGSSLRQNVCVLMIHFLVMFSLTARENPLLAPGNVSAAYLRDRYSPLPGYVQLITLVMQDNAQTAEFLATLQ